MKMANLSLHPGFPFVRVPHPALANRAMFICGLLSAGITLTTYGASVTNSNLGSQPLQTPTNLVSVGPHERVWRPVVSNTGPRQHADTRVPNPKGVVEIASGMNRWDGEAQQWVPSEPGFLLSLDGSFFAADRIQHQTHVAANLNTPGAVQTLAPNGTSQPILLSSTPVAIGLYDAATGSNAIIAGITNCSGYLVAETDGKQIVFPDAFNENGVKASVRMLFSPLRWTRKTTAFRAPQPAFRFLLNFIRPRFRTAFGGRFASKKTGPYAKPCNRPISWTRFLPLAT
jgi:hypothetical protein